MIEADHQRQPDAAQGDRRTESEDDHRVQRDQRRRVTHDGPPVGRPGEHAKQPRQVPVVGRAVDDREERNPQAPAHVHDGALRAPARPRHERLRRRIQVLPAGPLVMAPVHAGPAVIRNQREGRGDAAGDGVPAPRAEQRVVPALVKDDEPLDEHHRQEHLSADPQTEAAAKRQEQSERRASGGHADDAEAGRVSRPKVRQFCRMRRPVRSCHASHDRRPRASK